eukprot:scaffold3973_cov198-Prasinococcus_capsulatus_cf.AAC.2
MSEHEVTDVEALLSRTPQQRAQLTTIRLTRRDEIPDVQTAERVGAALRHCSRRLRVLTLRETFLTIEHAGLAALAPALRECTALEELDLYLDGIGEAGARALAEALPHGMATTLRVLKLPDDGLGGAGLGGAGLAALAPALRECTALEELDLDSNRIGEAGARALAEALPHGMATTLRVLKLRNNGLFSTGLGDAGLAALAPALRECTALEELDLDSNRIGEAGTRALAEAFPQRMASTLRVIKLSNVNIGAAAFRLLAPKLSQCSVVEELDLSGNKMQKAGMLAVAESLAGVAGSLRVLKLGSNPTTSSEAHETIATALCQCTALQELHLPSNRVGEAGAFALVEAIRRMPNLRVLDLDKNGIGDKAAEGVVEALAKHRTVEVLRLGKCAMTTLPLAICDLPKLKELNLKENKLLTPPREVVRRGMEEVLQFMRDMRGDAAENHRLKVMLLGKGRAGKTSLVKRLTTKNREEPDGPTQLLE